MRDGRRWTATMEPSLQMNLSKRKIPIIAEQIQIIVYRALIFIRFFALNKSGYKQLVLEIRKITFIWKILYLISWNKNEFIFVLYSSSVSTHLFPPHSFVIIYLFIYTVRYILAKFTVKH